MDESEKLVQTPTARHDAYWTVPPISQRGPSDDESTHLTATTDKADSEHNIWSESSWLSGSTPTGFAADNYIIKQFEQLAHENQILKNKLTSAYERLNVVLEISEKASVSNDARVVQADLLDRYVDILAAGDLLIDREGCCTRISTVEPDAVVAAPSRIRVRLNNEINQVRQTRHACHYNLAESLRFGLGSVHVLLSPLRQDSRETHVVIAIRRGDQPPFNQDDRLASETILVYGGHILHNTAILQHLQRSSFETVGALANAIEARDQYTGGHSERVGWLAALTGKALNLSPDDLQMLEWSGLLHDVGKIGIPEHILNKPGGLTDEEFQQIKRHPQLGYDVLRPVSSLKPVLDAVLYHHEDYAGGGYPDGLAGNEIPLPARILHVVDIFDALTSTRSYRKRLDIDQALMLLLRDAGTTTDPVVTAAFIGAFEEYQQSEPEDYRRRFAHL